MLTAAGNANAFEAECVVLERIDGPDHMSRRLRCECQSNAGGPDRNHQRIVTQRNTIMSTIQH